MRRRLFAVLAAAALVAGVAVPAGASSSSSATWEVTITNVNATQWFTPPVVATHGGSLGLVRPGYAGIEIQEVAENGNLAPLLASLEASTHVHSVVVAATEAGPLAPGQSVTIQIEGDKRARYLFMASMLICTNDGFTGMERRPLPGAIGHSRTFSAVAFDAGTEVNTEDFADIVPPCQLLNGVSSDDDGTGMSDPGLAENARIHRHRGIKGINDLTAGAHGWNVHAPVVEISVTRTG